MESVLILEEDENIFSTFLSPNRRHGRWAVVTDSWPRECLTRWASSSGGMWLVADDGQKTVVHSSRFAVYDTSSLILLYYPTEKLNKLCEVAPGLMKQNPSAWGSAAAQDQLYPTPSRELHYHNHSLLEVV